VAGAPQHGEFAELTTAQLQESPAARLSRNNTLSYDGEEQHGSALAMRPHFFSFAVAVATLVAVNAASAADLPARGLITKAPAAVVADNWSGFYVGVIGGYAAARAHADPTGILPAIGAYPVEFTADGGFVGGQIGYDHQFGNGVVLGIVGDGSWADLKGKACSEVTPGRCSDGDPRDSYAIGKVNWIATVRGKLGMAVTPSALLYATGGAAFAGTTSRDTFIDGVHDIKADSTRDGWTVGAGAQYKIARNISFGAEYLYADFGGKSLSFNSSGLNGLLAGQDISINTRLKLHIFKAALNYHF
jgi:outer membrane immunogenic protein